MNGLKLKAEDESWNKKSINRKWSVNRIDTSRLSFFSRKENPNQASQIWHTVLSFVLNEFKFNLLWF